MKITNLPHLLGLTLLVGCNNPDSESSLDPDVAGTSDATDEAGSTGTTDETGSTGEDTETTGTTGDECAIQPCVPPEPTILRLTLAQVKQFRFDWSPAAGAEWYQLKESVNGEPHVAVGDVVTGLETSLTVPLHFRVNASYVLQACNEWGCTDSDVVEVVGNLVAAIGYVKASNTSTSDIGDVFGNAVALSGDGNTLAVGADAEDSGATGVDGNQADDSSHGSGAVYVFVRDGSTWKQQGYLKASNTDENDGFGSSVALSDDGDTLAVGADSEDSSAMGIEGNQANDTASAAGAVYVFDRDDGEWTQQAYVKASNTDGDDWFGSSVALSADGDTLAVGAIGEDSSATGVGHDEADDTAPDAGAVYVFERDDDDWKQQAYVKASNTDADDWFGWSVALSSDGDTLAVSAPWEASDTKGIDGNQEDDSKPGAGAVYVFEREDEDWSQQAYVKASNTDAYDAFGYCVALSDDGDRLAVGAGGEYSNAVGIDGDESDDSAHEAGAAYVFERNDEDWEQDAYVKASNTDAFDHFGVSVALSGDGSILVVGAPEEHGKSKGIDGDGIDDSADQAGAAYVYVYEGDTLMQRAYVKASNTESEDFFGASVTISSDGQIIAIGAPWEDSSAKGVSGEQDDDFAVEAGAVYLY